MIDGTNVKKLRELTERLPFLGRWKEETPVTVLIVEKEPSVSKLILDILQYFGCQGMSVSNIKEASKAMNNNKFDVLLSDTVLKDKTDIPDILKEFQGKFPGSLIIIMSGSEEKLISYSKCFATLAMPFGMYDLVKQVRNGLK